MLFSFITATKIYFSVILLLPIKQEGGNTLWTGYKIIFNNLNSDVKKLIEEETSRQCAVQCNVVSRQTLTEMAKKPFKQNLRRERILNAIKILQS